MNGYPYKTLTQLGVESIDDAYVATKQAIEKYGFLKGIILLGVKLIPFSEGQKTK